jgi:hypothetical protein
VLPTRPLSRQGVGIVRLAKQEYWTRRQLLVLRARRVMLSALAGLLVVQLGLNLLVEGRNSAGYDDEFVVRLPVLHERMAEAPGQPLLLVVGSSRCCMGFLPEVLPPLQTPSGEKPVVFNFSHQGSGPIFNLILLHRLLRRGICPRWLVLEIMPPCLNHEHYSVSTTCGELDDLPDIWRYFSPVKTTALVLRARLFPSYRQRLYLCDTYLPPLAVKTVAEDLAYIRLLPQGGDGGWWLVDEIDPEDKAMASYVARKGYRERLQQFQIKPAADRAVRETLQLCRDHGIGVALLLMPEGSEFQSWYAPWALPQVDAFCQNLSSEYGVPVVDARHWLPDEVFTDSHHPLLAGATQFTKRLAREVLQPMIEGRLRLGKGTAP